MDRGLIGALIGIGRHSLGFQKRTGIEMQHAFGAKSETILADGGMPGIAAPEIFRHRLFDAIDNPLAQRRDVPVHLDAVTALACGALVMGIALVSGLMAVRTLRHADPALLLR